MLYASIFNNGSGGVPGDRGAPLSFYPEGRTYSPPRRHKLHIPRPAASGRSRSFRCSSSPHKAKRALRGPLPAVVSLPLVGPCALRGGCGSCGSLQPMLPKLQLRSSLPARRNGVPFLRLRKRVGLEPLPPVSVPFRLFLSRLTSRASARRRSLGAKIPRKLPAHRCFAVSAEQIWAEARRSPQGILLYFQGLERSIGPNLPAQTGRCSSPTRFNLPPAALSQRPGRSFLTFPGFLFCERETEKDWR